MRKKIFGIILLIFLSMINLIHGKILVPMDLTQSNHLKAYGIAYYALENGINVEWLLNYKGGAFLFDNFSDVKKKMLLRNVSFENVSPSQVAQIYSDIENNNMERMLLEVAPKIAVYMPKTALPWDDAVRLALDYSEIPYTTIYDKEILRGDLKNYDWLHLFHEDFTGQYGKFYASYGHSDWYLKNRLINEKLAHQLGYKKVWQMKQDVVMTIKRYVAHGGFLFAMCAATDTYDIALAAYGIDIVPKEIDGDGIDPNAQKKLNYKNTFFFKNFKLITSPYVYEFSDIDTSDYYHLKGAEADYFTLFSFSAKYDPIPTMLTQDHVGVINGFLGQTTGFKKNLIKKTTVILGLAEGTNEVKYIHRTYKKGTVTFLGGHDPEDYQHRVGDPPTDLKLHPNSPGYRLILNNILFPAAKKKKLKT